MRPLSTLGVILSILFCFLFIFIIAEVYYLLWWKNKTPSTNPSRELKFIPKIFLKRLPSMSTTPLNPTQVSSDSSIKPFAMEEGIEAELMRLQNLSGPTRLLFTIKEETKEDMEDQRSRKGSRGRSLSDITFSPLSSPPVLTPFPNQQSNLDFSSNPLFIPEVCSPPPRLKFLRDAEEKLYRKTLLEEAMKVGFCQENLSSHIFSEQEQEGSFIRILNGKQQHHLLH